MEIEAIQDLIKNDEETRRRIAAQYEKRHKLKQELDAEKKRLTEAAQAAVQAQMEAERQKLDAQIKEEAKKNRDYLARASAGLQTMYTENKERWRRELFERAIKEKQG